MEYNGKNFMIEAKDPYYGELLIDFDDIILRHQQPQYDHLRIHGYNFAEHEDPEDATLEIAALFLGQISLDILAGQGVPEAFRDEPTPGIVAAYKEDLFARLEGQFDE